MGTNDGDPARYYSGLLIILNSFHTSDALELGAIVLLILCSALISGSESAFFSLKGRQLIELRQHKSGIHDTIIYLHERPKMLLATILVANTLVNIMIAILATQLLDSLLPQGEGSELLRKMIEVIGITFTLVLFGEVIPKIYSAHNNVKFASFMAYPLLALSKFFSPVSYLLIRSTNLIEKRLQKNGHQVSMEEIRHAIEITSGHESTVEEKKILRGIVNFGNIYVKQIMRPRTDVEAHDVRTSFPQLIEAINENRYSRIPVYNGSFDKVVGILYIKDVIPFLDEGPGFDWPKLVRKPYFVPETKKIDVLLQEFKQKKVHMAIVVDEYGGTSGIVTLEDVLEEIVGDINDEFDEEELFYSKLDEENFVFDGKTTLADVARVMDLNENVFDPIRGEAETIGGLMAEMSGKIPDRGQVIRYKNYSFTVEMVDRRRVRRVKVSIMSQLAENNPD